MVFRNSREPLEFCHDQHFCLKFSITGEHFFFLREKSKNLEDIADVLLDRMLTLYLKYISSATKIITISIQVYNSGRKPLHVYLACEHTLALSFQYAFRWWTSFWLDVYHKVWFCFSVCIGKVFTICGTFFFPPFQKDYKKTGEIDPTSVITPKDPGDIPTFDEWKKKVMEVEKEKSKFRICFL